MAWSFRRAGVKTGLRVARWASAEMLDRHSTSAAVSSSGFAVNRKRDVRGLSVLLPSGGTLRKYLLPTLNLRRVLRLLRAQVGQVLGDVVVEFG